MKKTGLLFIILCMAVCFVPLLGMTVRPTTETTENRNLSTFPSLKTEDGSLNLGFFKKFETWFHEHFAFRNEMVYADAKIQGDVFHVSSEDKVIYGKDDWLFYSSSLNDFVGMKRFTDREKYAVRTTLEMTADYLRDKGISMVLVAPPNKNTLYGQFMPYYDSLIADGEHTVDWLADITAEEGIPYADLTALLRNEDETMYLKRDSHWNNKGAFLAYNSIMEALGCEYDRYADTEPVWEQTEDGDLNRMLYSFYGEKEFNYRYDIPQAYQVTNGAESVEDVWIETACQEGNGKLLMFRDSFGNTLIPFVANQFAQAWFSKEAQYRLEMLADLLSPDYVVVEKSERTFRTMMTLPPIITAPQVQLPSDVTAYSDTEDTDTEKETRTAGEGNTAAVESVGAEKLFYKISGTVDGSLLNAETDIVVSVNGTPYRAYLTGEDSYAMFLPTERIPEFPVQVQVMTLEGDEAVSVLEEALDLAVE